MPAPARPIIVRWIPSAVQFQTVRYVIERRRLHLRMCRNAHRRTAPSLTSAGGCHGFQHMVLLGRLGDCLRFHILQRAQTHLAQAAFLPAIGAAVPTDAFRYRAGSTPGGFGGLIEGRDTVPDSPHGVLECSRPKEPRQSASRHGEPDHRVTCPLWSALTSLPLPSLRRLLPT